MEGREVKKIEFDYFRPPQPPLPPERCGYCHEWSEDAGHTGVCSDCYDLAHADFERIAEGILRDYREVFARLAKT